MATTIDANAGQHGRGHQQRLVVGSDGVHDRREHLGDDHGRGQGEQDAGRHEAGSTPGHQRAEPLGDRGRKHQSGRCQDRERDRPGPAETRQRSADECSRAARQQQGGEGAIPQTRHQCGDGCRSGGSEQHDGKGRNHPAEANGVELGGRKRVQHEDRRQERGGRQQSKHGAHGVPARASFHAASLR